MMKVASDKGSGRGAESNRTLTGDACSGPAKACLPTTHAGLGLLDAGDGTDELCRGPHYLYPGACHLCRGPADPFPGPRHALVGPDHPCRLQLTKMAEKRHFMRTHPGSF